MYTNCIYLGVVICSIQFIYSQAIARYYAGLQSYTCPGPCVAEELAWLKCIRGCALSPGCKDVSFNPENKTSCCQCSSDGIPQKMPGNILYLNVKEKVCSDDLVDGIPDASMTASSTLSGNSASRGRLNTKDSSTTRGAWCPSTKHNRNDYIQVRFHDIKEVIGIVTQSRHRVSFVHYVTSYKVSVSLDCVNFSFIRATDNMEMVFPGNYDTETTVLNNLPEPWLAVCVRVYPVTYYSYPAMRIGIKGCNFP